MPETTIAPKVQIRWRYQPHMLEVDNKRCQMWGRKRLQEHRNDARATDHGN